ncbi:MAG: hypothetical protein WKF43_06065 [Acidimicrobiales bacterium]
MDPVLALERVSYLLDRALAPAQKSKAFLNAADVLKELPRGDLAARHAAGKLKELPGIGDSTAKVIAEALDGQVPARVVELEASTEIPLGEGGAIRAALRGDCHSHSVWSDGGPA